VPSGLSPSNVVRPFCLTPVEQATFLIATPQGAMLQIAKWRISDGSVTGPGNGEAQAGDLCFKRTRLTESNHRPTHEA